MALVMSLVLIFGTNGVAEYACQHVASASEDIIRGIERQLVIENSGVSEDGKYDGAVDTCVVNWANANGYIPGEVRPGEILVNLVRSHYMGYPISMYEPSDELLAVQALLRRWGFYAGEIVSAPGDDLAIAVSEFRSYLSIPTESAAEIDYETAEAMFYGFSPLTSTISWPSPAKDIIRVQRRLSALSYYEGAIDGVWDDSLSAAVARFQADHNIVELDAGFETQSLLFSDRCELTVDLSKGYKIIVSIKGHYVSILGWANGGWNKEVKHFVCSCGAKKTPTPKGDFKLIERSGSWHQLNAEGWCRYAYRVHRYVYFHSWLYAFKGDTKIRQNSKELLGQNVSHGCIRMSVDDCKWLYENCEPGTPVHIS